MIKGFKIVEADYYKLDELNLSDNQKVLYIINKDDVKFEFLINRKVKSEKLIIFGSGAYDYEKIQLPVFQRYSWASEFEENCIYYNDPTLYLGKISLGWGYGTKDDFYLEIISNIINRFIELMNINKRNIAIYGSSGGGFMAIGIATHIRGIKAIVNNPQTNISKYYESSVAKLFCIVYTNDKLVDIYKIHPERINLIELFKKKNYIPEIVYMQNLACSFDMNNQCMPFINELKNINYIMFNNKIKMNFYSNKEQNHSPLSKAETIKIIKETLDIQCQYKNIIDIQSGEWEEFSKRDEYSLFRYDIKTEKNIIGNNYIIKMNDKIIKRKVIKNIDMDGYGDIYGNGYIYLSIKHSDISQDGIIDNEKIRKYFSKTVISIYY